MIKIWYEVEGEFVKFSLQNADGESILPFGKTYKSQAVKYLNKEKRRMLSQIPVAFSTMTKHIKQGILNEEN